MKKNNIISLLLLMLILCVFPMYKYVFTNDLIKTYDEYYDYLNDLAVREEYKNGSINVKIDINKKITKYGTIGHDLKYFYECNGKSFKDGETIKVGKQINLVAIYKEIDGSYTDVGEAEITISNPSIKQEKTTTLTITERGGRYSGSTQTWEITYQITPVANKNNIHFRLLEYLKRIEYLPILIFEIWQGFIIAISSMISKENNDKNKIVNKTSRINLEKQNNQNVKNDVSNTNNTANKEAILCPKCGRKMVLRNGKYGQFYGCSNYPYCKGTRAIHRKTFSNKCPKCGSPMYKRYTSTGTIYFCRKTKECGYQIKQNVSTEI